MLPDTDCATAIYDHGQIRHMSIPPGWEEGEPEAYLGIGYRSFREVHPMLDPAAKLCFFYRGGPIRPLPGERFHALITSPAHMLSFSEIKTLGEVLRDRQSPTDFAMTMARTEDISGKRVLVVEGRYLDANDETRALFVDADLTGRVIQEIYFQAPRQLYLRYGRLVRDMMNSIAWRS